jgi:hypothetical protein
VVPTNRSQFEYRAQRFNLHLVVKTTGHLKQDTALPDF